MAGREQCSLEGRASLGLTRTSNRRSTSNTDEQHGRPRSQVNGCIHVSGQRSCEACKSRDRGSSSLPPTTAGLRRLCERVRWVIVNEPGPSPELAAAAAR
jgi:hypothetical protein